MTSISKNKIFTDETAARRFLEAQRWPDGPVCPFCGQLESAKALPAKGSMGEGWYHCKDCRKKFTVRVGTLYERSHVPLHAWLWATHLLCASKKGMSAHQLHRMLGVTYKTAWFMFHRIREGMRELSPAPRMTNEELKVREFNLGPSAMDASYAIKDRWKNPDFTINRDRLMQAEADFQRLRDDLAAFTKDLRATIAK